ncbi:MAG: VCBS repeat-containing protein [Gammaproteobacteria bacterium]|nr:VCBS repeat-containing protein [Gammaproteobacteria bacterium]
MVAIVAAVFFAWDRGHADPSHANPGHRVQGDANPGHDVQGDTGNHDHNSRAAAQPTSYAFDRHEIDIGPAVRQTVLSGFLLGGEVADLAVVTVEEDGGRRLRIYAFEGAPDEGGPGKAEARMSPSAEGTWALRTDTQLRPGVTFVDIARIDGRDRLITGEPGRLNAWDPDSSTEHELVSVASVATGFRAPHEGEVPHVDVTRDVNGDGRIDLVIPGDNGFQIYVQLDGGDFADPVVTGPPPNLDPILGADGYRFDPWSVSRIHEFDCDGDGRVDLVSWNGNHFEAHVQDEQGLFDPDPLTFTTDVRFDTDEVTSLADGEMTGRALHSFGDLNGDGIADMVVYVLAGARIREKRSAYEVYFGAHGVDGAGGSDGSPGSASLIQFSSSQDVSIQTENQVQLAMELRDLDGDGEGDLVVTSIEKKYLEGSLFKRIKGFMGDDVWLNVAFYHVRDGRIPDRATATRRIQLDGAPSPREPGWVPLEVVLQGGKHARRRDREQYLRAFNKSLFIGDVTGNDRADLLIEWTHRELHIYEGVPAPGLFADEPQKVTIELPNDEEFAWMTDLNRDGRQDIVMHHPFTNRDAHGAPMELSGTESHRVTLLIAR